MSINSIEEQQKITSISTKETLIVLAVLSFVLLISNWASTGNSIFEALPGMIILFAIIVVSLGIKHVVPLSLPVVAWVSLVSVVVTLPVSPIDDFILDHLQTLNFLSLVTPVLAYAAIAISRSEIALFKKSGFKIVTIALFVFVSTFLGSVIIADALL